MRSRLDAMLRLSRMRARTGNTNRLTSMAMTTPQATSTNSRKRPSQLSYGSWMPAPMLHQAYELISHLRHCGVHPRVARSPVRSGGQDRPSDRIF